MSKHWVAVWTYAGCSEALEQAIREILVERGIKLRVEGLREEVRIYLNGEPLPRDVRRAIGVHLCANGVIEHRTE